jgi:hypothetical protein
MCARFTARWLVPAFVTTALAFLASGRLLSATLEFHHDLQDLQATVPPDERVFGTWQLNLARSKFNPGPPYRSQTRVYERHEKGVRAAIKTTYSDGHTTEVEYVAGYDSLEYPVTGSPDYDSIKLKRVDAYTSEAVLGHAGKQFATARRTISEDGKTMTIVFQVDFAGSRVNNVMVYDRQ